MIELCHELSGISNSYIDLAVITVQNRFTRDIRHNYFKNSLEDLLGQLEKVKRKVKKIFFTCFRLEIMNSRTFFLFAKTNKSWQ